MTVKALKPSAPNAKGGTPLKLIPFTRASREHTEPGADTTVNVADFTAGQKTLPIMDVPAFGYARGLWILVEATGGIGVSVFNPDGPWNFIQEITLSDVNGTQLVGPMSGLDLFLANKWGGYDFFARPDLDPHFSPGTADGNFAFMLWMPFEIVSRDALGALPNMNAASTYKLRIRTGSTADVYSVPPVPIPAVRVRTFLEAWAAPAESDPLGRPQAVRPPAMGTTQFWSKASFPIASGSNTVRLSRVGNFIRNLILVFRDAAGARDNTNLPDPIQLHLDGRIVRNESINLQRSRNARRYGADSVYSQTDTLNDGVLVYPYTYDFDGHPGGEMRDLWMQTAQSTRLEIVGNFGTTGALDVLTNDIAPVAELV